MFYNIFLDIHQKGGLHNKDFDRNMRRFGRGWTSCHLSIEFSLYNMVYRYKLTQGMEKARGAASLQATSSGGRLCDVAPLSFYLIETFRAPVEGTAELFLRCLLQSSYQEVVELADRGDVGTLVG